MYVIVSTDKKCIVKGKSRKYLCVAEEPTRKELVAYESQGKARAARMRMMPLLSDGAMALYGGEMPELEIVEMEAGG
ncbi:hypothetical protein LJC63_00490 [Ruminococcaceae bacterium OttesenSCG-928-L11]|nr:hypothetical protein [Ruminococcaceae bacterium OttesenSCG-928-L11]